MIQLGSGFCILLLLNLVCLETSRVEGWKGKNLCGTVPIWNGLKNEVLTKLRSV
jgi:hypothetical protein